MWWLILFTVTLILVLLIIGFLLPESKKIGPSTFKMPPGSGPGTFGPGGFGE